MRTWNIKSSLEEWETVANTIEDELQSLGFSSKFIISLMLAMDEVIANITSYAYKDIQGDVVIKSEYELNDKERTAKITFVDYGEKFDPLENIKVPNVNDNDATKKEIGGLGIFMIKKQVNHLNYSYIENSNNLLLIKTELV